MKIAVLGAGHMGVWLIKMLSQDFKVCVFDIDRSRTEKIHSVEVISAYSMLKSFEPDLLINAVSLQNTIEAFESASPYLPDYCIISDVASVKGRIPDYYRRQAFRYASIHPMFGPTFANVDRIEDENVVIIKESDRKGRQFFWNFFSNLKLKIYEYSFDEHDQMIAYSLTLPFASTMVFAACMNNTAVPGTTFKKHLEIAKGLLSEDDYLLCEILFNSYSLPQLDKVTGRLEFLKHVIRGKDFEEAKKFFDCLRGNIQ